MTDLLLTRTFLTEFGRRPLNLVLLVVVPVLFVALTAGALADFAEAIGGIGDPELLAGPTAGWAAAFLAGVSGFFHVLGARAADSRLVVAGMSRTRVLVARMASGTVLALVAAVGALVALAVRTGISDPARAVGGTLMFALIYLGVGVFIGAVVRSEVNGSLIVVFVWMLDVFLGPAMGGSDVIVGRVFPSHFVTLVMLDAVSGHAGPLGDLGWALAWMVGALGLAALVFWANTGPVRVIDHARRPGAWRRLTAGLKAGLTDYRRNRAMWVLIVLLPIFFISLSFTVTPDQPTPVELLEGGERGIQLLSMADVHGAIMVPITIAFLAGLAGLFVVQGSLQADGRLVLAGFRIREVLAARLGVIALAALATSAVSLAITAVDFTPADWTWFVIGNLLVGATYGLIGVLVGAAFGRLGGLYVMFLLPFIDVGLAQNVMFSAAPPDWGAYLPARGAVRILVDAAFTPTMDELGALLGATGWLLVIVAAAAWVFGRRAVSRLSMP